MATKDDFLVKRCLNHANPSVTAIYVRTSQEEVAAALQGQADRFWALQAGPSSTRAPSVDAGRIYTTVRRTGVLEPPYRPIDMEKRRSRRISRRSVGSPHTLAQSMSV